MMKRMAYKDETGYHLHMELDDSPVKRLFELEEEAARRENARKIHVADLRGGPPHDRKGEGGTYFRRASRVSLMASMLPEPSSSM